MRLCVSETLGAEALGLAELDGDGLSGVGRQKPVRHGPTEYSLKASQVAVLDRLGRHRFAGLWVHFEKSMILEPNDVLRGDPPRIIVSEELRQLTDSGAVGLVGTCRPACCLGFAPPVFDKACERNLLPA